MQHSGFENITDEQETKKCAVTYRESEDRGHIVRGHIVKVTDRFGLKSLNKLNNNGQ